MSFFDLLSMVGGLALFLYGMHILSEGLEKLSGGRLERILENLTNSKWKAVLLGAGVTAVIQSSSATTVMVVGFVNSGIMKLKQAIGVIMGANVGTTVTSWILSLTGIESDNFLVKLLKPTSFSPLLAIVGVIFIMFLKNGKKRDLGTIFVGFAILMFGMDAMSSAMKPLSDIPEFTRGAADSDNPVIISFYWYFAGTVRNRNRYVCCCGADYYGTEYRYLCNSNNVWRWRDQKCKTRSYGTFIV